VQPERDGYMITEDHYIEYLAESPMESLLPSRLLQKMRDKHHFLFLGYSLRDWNLRVFLRRLKRNTKGQFRSWAVLLDGSRYDEQFWVKNDVDIIKAELNPYIEMLRAEMTLQSKGRAQSA